MVEVAAASPAATDWLDWFSITNNCLPDPNLLKQILKKILKGQELPEDQNIESGKNNNMTLSSFGACEQVYNQVCKLQYKYGKMYLCCKVRGTNQSCVFISKSEINEYIFSVALASMEILFWE